MVYNLGFPDAAATPNYTNNRLPFFDRTNSYDLSVTNTTLFHGNWDAFTKTQIFRSDIANHTPVDSLYLVSKPSWFASLTFPPFNPATGYTNLYWTSIPAGWALVNANANGTPQWPDDVGAFSSGISGAVKLNGAVILR
jgi:hypothetical protein